VSSTEAKDQMEASLLLDVVICEGAAVIELFSIENEALLIGRDSWLVGQRRIGINTIEVKT
jgi:hypothetical protein